MNYKKKFIYIDKNNYDSFVMMHIIFILTVIDISDLFNYQEEGFDVLKQTSL